MPNFFIIPLTYFLTIIMSIFPVLEICLAILFVSISGLDYLEANPFVFIISKRNYIWLC